MYTSPTFSRLTPGPPSSGTQILKFLFNGLFARNIKTRNGTDLDPFRGTEQQNRERFAMHAGTERKTPERFMERNGTDRNGNGHISTPLASQKPMTSAIFMSRRDLQLLFFLKNRKNRSRDAARTPARRPDPRPAAAWTGPDRILRNGSEQAITGLDWTGFLWDG